MIPNFTPVTAGQYSHHIARCQFCRGPMADWCPDGREMFENLCRQTRKE